MMEYYENQDFEELDEYNDEVGYDEYSETIDDRLEENYDEGLHQELAEKGVDDFVLSEVLDQTESSSPEYLDPVGRNLYEDRTNEYVDRDMTEAPRIDFLEDDLVTEEISELDVENAKQGMLERPIDLLLEEMHDEQRHEELAKKSVDDFVLNEVADQADPSSPEYLDPVGSNLYEDRTAEYVERDITEAPRIGFPEDTGISERINEIDVEDAEQRMLEQSIKDFENNEHSYQRNKEFDVPWRQTVPRYRRYSSGKSQQQIMRRNRIGQGYQINKTHPKYHQY